ncbi:MULTISPECIES: ABC transporter ATP-binding protein [unclassified Pseudodesulfovibrio]|uniref:ABC transporter ATP-binding protein n=1 Tax=unclassified Pseudodesulfovibrio TaxID=2661612 RepID=UPI000FEBF13D|nr:MULTISPECIES: ABC transporter ATP-binding protein [unclassified Pseudodesulfovibrio]MCJ2166166.1 ABC transporter ATP-binding protein [Pseudodesulfovibrio sp. S3-i]RWU02367.1 ABC transporter ATP-binding protein [Pseudodesulfovibrio sp. S3]
MFEARNIIKTFRSDGVETHALNGVTINVEPGQFVSIVGRSGSGKTTFLNVLSTLLAPDSGELLYNGRDITAFTPAQLNRLRRRDFAVIFQFHHLLPYLSARENVLLPYMQGFGLVSNEAKKRADQCLERVGLSGKGAKLPGHLSGGEQQRVAIARALVKQSALLFADEPTGNLDKETGESIMDLLADLKGEGLSIVMVTHDNEYAGRADRVVSMDDGRIVG